MSRKGQTLLTRLHKYIRRNELITCWIWTGTVAPDTGQPVIGWKEKLLKVRRVMWTLYHGSISGSDVINLGCGNPKCVNPEHFILGQPAAPLSLKELEVNRKFPAGVYFGDKLSRAEREALGELA